jgi:hypothetical protein
MMYDFLVDSIKGKNKTDDYVTMVTTLTVMSQYMKK